MSEREAGPKASFHDVETLFREHARFVASFLRRLGAPEAEVDDLVQEVFVVAHRKGGFEAGSAHPRTWLCAIALRVGSTHRRARGRRREQKDEAALHAATTPESASRTVDARIALGRVQRALDALDLQHRAAFVLYELEGESCEVIAQALEVPVGTVYSRLYTARRRFLETYRALERDELGARSGKLSGGGR